jgi:hypothetical protein
MIGRVWDDVRDVRLAHRFAREHAARERKSRKIRNSKDGGDER